MDSKTIQNTVDSLAVVVRHQYVDADVAIRADTFLRKCLEDGRYANATPDELAKKLTEDLFTASHDKHLFVKVISEANARSREALLVEESRVDAARHSNYGVQRTEILPGNIGYLKLTSFYRPEEARQTVSAAMRVLAHADALILDLRDNSGGSPDMAVLVASYMFDKAGIPLFEIVPRSGEGARLYATVQTQAPEKNGKRPLYVLTSEHTWSAGEGVAFLLQERHRAEVIGETTAGAANPGRIYEVNALFNVNVPNGRVKSAVLGRNWEGVGVVPDTPTTATEALRVAQIRAVRRLHDQTSKGPWRDELERQLQILEAQPKP